MFCTTVVLWMGGSSQAFVGNIIGLGYSSASHATQTLGSYGGFKASCKKATQTVKGESM